MKVQYFKALHSTNRYRKGQKIWINSNQANHLYTFHKWRGSGRYVNGTVDKFSKFIGEIKTIEVENKFSERISNSKH